MGFDSYLGNAALLDTLKKQLANNRLPHTLLFAGPEGIGKSTLARFLAKAVNCLTVKGTDFCDHCPSCQKINANSHADVKEVEPDGQFIKIEQARELSKEVFFRPFEGKRRFFIINQAERLKLEAANSLLKTLEEPPETSHLILVTDRPNDLLSTIRSRSQMYRFSPLSPETIEQILRQRKICSIELLPLLLRLSGGSVGKALSCDLKAYVEIRQELLACLDTIIPVFSYVQASRFLTSWAREKTIFEQKTELFFSLIHDLFLLKIDADSPYLTNMDLRDKLLEMAASISVQNLMGATEVLDHLETGAKRNINKALALDQLAFQLGGQI